jgi:hypothetical protein
MRRGLLGQTGQRNMSAMQFADLARKDDEKDGTFRYCKNEDCDYRMSVSNAELTSADAEKVSPSV